MATAVCSINLGVLKQRLYIQNKKYSNKKTMENYYLTIEEMIPFIAKNFDITEVNLLGPIDLIQKIEHDVHQLEKIKYSKYKTKFNFI